MKEYVGNMREIGEKYEGICGNYEGICGKYEGICGKYEGICACFMSYVPVILYPKIILREPPPPTPQILGT